MPCTLSEFTSKNITPGQAQAYYACQYFDSIASTNLIRNILSVAQAATNLYFAQKNYEIQKGNLDRLNKITEQQLAQSADLHGQWAYGKQCERQQLDDACNTNIPEPNYQSIYSRVASVITMQYGNARRKVKQRFSVYCQAAACAELRKIDLAEASAISAGVEAAYRKAEANWKVEKAAARVHLLNVLQHMRGLLASTGGLLNGAAHSAAAAAQINPYYGFSQAANQAFGAATAATYQGALAAQGAGQINGMNAFQSNNLVNGRSPTEGNFEKASSERQSLFFNDAPSMANTGSNVNTDGNIKDIFNWDAQGNNFMSGQA
jgi:hypothetical protein